MLDPEIVAVHEQEVRRGSVVVASLLMLRTPGKLLEKQGLLLSEWNTDESRPRKFYRTSDAGRELAASLLREWTALSGSLDALGHGTTEARTEGDAP